jgi:hypothetical protein
LKKIVGNRIAEPVMAGVMLHEGIPVPAANPKPLTRARKSVIVRSMRIPKSVLQRNGR